MLRVVFDSNVYISALIFKGYPRQILELAIKRKVILVSSNEIINETSEKLKVKFFWPDYRIQDFIHQISELAHIFKPENRISVIEDEPDNRILECAVEGKANLIISGDNHLLRLKSYNNIPIQPPKYLTFLFEEK